MYGLVGKYLVITGAGSVLKNGNWVANYGHYSILESASGNGDDWKVIESALTDEPMPTLELAQATADSLGIGRARLLQNDFSLEVKSWCVPFPVVPKG
ncbi:hypothetical protein [Dyella humicola]|uniref:hypothetical protein n=1 Tax=Dyella humicola TaxID=2992126 RepID=UPI00224ECBD1|nr:hypothetical protein [Dyella humicola]